VLLPQTITPDQVEDIIIAALGVLAFIALLISFELAARAFRRLRDDRPQKPGRRQVAAPRATLGRSASAAAFVNTRHPNAPDLNTTGGVSAYLNTNTTNPPRNTRRA
jgi:hypothetical protein